ncbi:MAG TPA: DUF4476 domain-containing protein, partial [Puia sp.]|nr:DUF4476 domain-containing protein [Puia sp.]
MQRIRVLFVLLMWGPSIVAQKNHFIAIQSENKQAIFAKLSGVVVHSSPTGHLIVPRLIDSTYIITLGFSKGSPPEEKFSITVSQDAGFILRVTKDKSIILSNSHTGQLIQPEKVQAEVFTIHDSSSPGKKDEAFSKLMSEAVNDSAVMENMTVANEPKKEIANEPKKDIANAARNEVAMTQPSSQPKISTDSGHLTTSINRSQDSTLVAKKQLAKTTQKKPKQNSLPSQLVKPTITKLSEQKDDISFEQVYELVDKTGKKDTVGIKIQFDTSTEPAKGSVAFTERKDRRTDTKVEPTHVTKTDSPLQKSRQEPSALNAPMDSSSDKRQTAPPWKPNKPDSVQIDTSKSRLYRQATTIINCKGNATDNDLDRLRIKIMAIEDEDDKVSTAKKSFKAKCYTTNQIKALSEVFGSDAGKYKLFDAAYFYVYDPLNYGSLQSLLKDSYYIARFR